MKSIVILLLSCQMLVSGLLFGLNVDQSAQLVDLIKYCERHRQTEFDLGFLDSIDVSP